MADIIACPRGITLPYSSIFNVDPRVRSARLAESRPSDYFWNRATQASPRGDVEEPRDDVSLALSLRDGEDEQHSNQPKLQKKSKRHLRFTRLRTIAFKAFTPKADGTGQKNNIVTTTEIVSRHDKVNSSHQKGSKKENTPLSVFRSWKLKSKAGGAQLQKMVAVVKHRISASSPPDQQPKNWEEYHRFYANEQIDVLNPPLPPMESSEGETPNAFEAKFYPAPRPLDQPVRMLVLNRLGMFGMGFATTDEAAALTKARYELGDKLIEEGKAPSSLDMPWESRTSVGSERSDIETIESPAVPRGLDLLPETLEQHPVFRRIVQQCRELFDATVGILSVIDDERQIFLAESGLSEVPALAGLREVTRDITFCAHTVLSGRKGFTVLDTHKDWRFQNGPLVQNFGLRFYAGVPLMAPNLDGSKESEENTCPIGTLCIVDFKPRENFSTEDRKKLVYLSEYARREIEKWFAKKMEIKMNNLVESKETWKQELKRIDSNTSVSSSAVETEVLFDPAPSSKWRRGSSGPLRSVSSASSVPTSPSSHTTHSLKSPVKVSVGLFDDFNSVLKPNMRKVFDLATKLVAETLDLSLVYLAAAAPYEGSSQLGRTMIISGHNIPLPVPAFDTGLHLKALRTPEGGLLYQNPSVEEAEEDGLQPKAEGNSNPQSYASAMLLAVSAETKPNGGGFILAGYTNDPKRVFGAEDVSYMKQFAHELSRYTNKLRL